MTGPSQSSPNCATPLSPDVVEAFAEADYAVLYRIVPDSGSTTSQEICNVSAEDCSTISRLSAATSGPVRGGDNPSEWQTRVFRAAERANAKFGQWMPQRWLELFIGEMNVLDEMVDR